MTKFRAPRTRLAPDADLVVGMRLADEDGRVVTVELLTTRIAMVTGTEHGLAHGFVRLRWPFVA